MKEKRLRGQGKKPFRKWNWRERRFETIDPNVIDDIDDAIQKLRDDQESTEMAVEIARSLRGTEETKSEETPDIQNAERQALSVSNLPDKEQVQEPRNMSVKRKLNMDEEPAPEDVPMLAMSEAGPTSSLNQKQTTAVIPRQVEMSPFTEQRTVCLPLTFYVSMNRLEHTTPSVLRFRLNNHWNVLKDQNFVAQTVSTIRTKGVSNDYAMRLPFEKDPWNDAYLVPFPTSLTGSTPATATTSSFGSVNDSNIVPKYRGYYEGCWQAYANYKTEYKVTILNAAEQRADLQHVKLFTTTTQYTQSQGTTGNLPPDNATLADMINFPNFTEHNVAPRNVNTESSDYVVLKGTWTPNSTKQLNVFNDEDVKTWYPTKNENNTLWEQFTIYAYKHDMYPVAPRVTSEFFTGATGTVSPEATTGLTGVFIPRGNTHINLKVELKYYVVYKDLDRAIRYTTSGDANNTLLSIDHLKQTPRTREFVPNTSPNTGAG